ncbi:MAG TPA: WecB/TagA/CpsF family glycosyltransferase [Gemmatimonadales bacterium]
MKAPTNPRLQSLPVYHLLGVPVNAINVELLFELVEDAIASGNRRVIANHNLHSVYLYHHDAKMRQYYSLASATYVDGTPMIQLGRLLGYPLRMEHRITAIQWIKPLLSHGIARGWRTFLLGGKPGTAARAADILRQEIPGLQIESSHGYFNPTPGHPEAEDLLAAIARYRPNILCLGMGMPRQEHWIADFFDRIDANLVFNLGGFMELLTGELPLPPRWVGPAGVEWLFRLVTRPRRVWRRYLVEPWALVPWLVRDLAGRPRKGQRTGDVVGTRTH